MEITEKKIKELIISNLDNLFDRLIEIQENKNCSQKEINETESILMSFRNVIAGIEWDGNKREYEKYSIK